MRFCKIILFFIFYSSILQASSDMDEYEDRIERIRWEASKHIGRAKMLGLTSPYMHSSRGCTDWTDLFVKDFQGYADFSAGFDYLFWWNEERALQTIRYQKGCITEILKSNKNNSSDTNVLHRQDIIDKVQQQTPRIQIVLEEGQAAVFQKFDLLYQELSCSDSIFQFHKGYFLFDHGKSI